jgi:hypothetical protein
VKRKHHWNRPNIVVVPFKEFIIGKFFNSAGVMLQKSSIAITLVIT